MFSLIWYVYRSTQYAYYPLSIFWLALFAYGSILAGIDCQPREKSQIWYNMYNAVQKQTTTNPYFSSKHLLLFASEM